MGKYEKRRHFRAMRAAKVPFAVAVLFSRKSTVDRRFCDLPEGFTRSETTYCPCCGPVSFTVSETRTGKSWTFGWFSGTLE